MSITFYPREVSKRKRTRFRLLIFILGGWTQRFFKPKAVLRKRILAKRAAIPADEFARRSADACNGVLEMLRGIDPSSGYIGLYSAQGSELSLNHLIVQLANCGYHVAFPARVSNTEMEFFSTVGVSDEVLFASLLVNNPFTAVNSTDIAHLTKVDPAQLRALIVPAVAYDKDGYRLGFGGGYYDRYLRRIASEVPRYGIGFEEQMVQKVPLEPHDLPLDLVIVSQSAIISQSFQTET